MDLKCFIIICYTVNCSHRNVILLAVAPIAFTFNMPVYNFLLVSSDDSLLCFPLVHVQCIFILCK